MTAAQRKKKNQTVVWLILGLLVVSLMGFGVRSVGTGGAQAVASVGDEEVTVDTYVLVLRNRLNALSQQLGQNVSLEQAQALGIDRQVMSEVLAAAAFDGEARNRGLSVGDNRVRDDLLATPAFQGMNGNFDSAAYEAALEQAGLSPGEYDEIVRKNASRALLRAAVTGGVDGSDTFALALLSFISEERDFRWAALDDSQLDPPVGTPDDAQIESQYRDNPAAYTAPEIRRITYVWMTPEMRIPKIEVDEQDLRARYEAESARYNIPARRIVDRLVFATREEAEEALSQITSGSKIFEDIVANRGLAIEDIDMGELTRDDLSDAAAEAVFALDQPGIVGPVDTDLGPALFRVNAVLKGQVTPFEEAREELKRELVADRARRQIDDDVTGIDDLLAGGATLEELAAETDLELGQIDFRPGTDTGIAAYQEFREAANSVSKEDFPEIITLPDGGIFALRLDSITPPALQPLSEVRTRVVSDWIAAETARRLKARAEEVRAGLENGKSFGDFGLAARGETGIRRDAFIEGAPSGMVLRAFEMTPGEASVVTGDGRVAVVQLMAITPYEATGETAETLSRTLSQQFALQVATDIEAAFGTALQESAGIRINQALVNAVNTQLGTGGGVPVAPHNDAVPHNDADPH